MIFGGRNTTGEREAGGYLGFSQWADENDIFLVGPGFKDDEYWQPAKWSGKLLDRALQIISKAYKINTNRILYYGLSAGSQCSNLFAAWKPDNCVAWASHGCGVWHTPRPAMRKVPGLVTCGDADVNRYILSRKFTAQCRRLGINIILKSFPNSPHDVPPASVVLAKAFLLYHHYRNIQDLNQSSHNNYQLKKIPVCYIGDDQENKFWDISSREVDFIDISDKVSFPTKEIAEAWGKFEPTKWPQKNVKTSNSVDKNDPPHKYEHLTVNTSAGQNRNLEISIRVPEYNPSERKETYLMVLFGGRNWPGDKTIDTYNFNKLADRYGIYLISPSFTDDDYWHPEKWSGEALFTAINKIKQKYNLKNLKVFYYGYSAGGQCANLFYAWRPGAVAAMGIHACGVCFNKNPSWEKIPVLITCGMDDKERFSYSYSMAQSLREAGHPIIWRNYDGGGHELTPHALAMARQFFQEIISGHSEIKYVAEDYANKILSADSDEAKRIDSELCNKFFSLKMATLWANCNEADE